MNSGSVDYELTQADHTKIVDFSLLHSKKLKLEQRLKLLAQQKTLLSDAKDELLVSFDTTLYSVGECFMALSEADVEAELDLKIASNDAEIAELTAKLDDCNSTLAALKSELYGKFGDRINLES